MELLCGYAMVRRARSCGVDAVRSGGQRKGAETASRESACRQIDQRKGELLL
jgi:hypothetical protein